MKTIHLKEAGIDLAVTIQAKPIFMKKPSDDLIEEVQRLEASRILKHIAAGHEEVVAEAVAQEFLQRMDES